jgi:hypothetical protein
MRPSSHWSSLPIAASPGLNNPSPRIVTMLRSAWSSTFTSPRWISSARNVARRGAAAGRGGTGAATRRAAMSAAILSDMRLSRQSNPT